MIETPVTSLKFGYIYIGYKDRTGCEDARQAKAPARQQSEIGGMATSFKGRRFATEATLPSPFFRNGTEFRTPNSRVEPVDASGPGLPDPALSTASRSRTLPATGQITPRPSPLFPLANSTAGKDCGAQPGATASAFATEPSDQSGYSCHVGAFSLGVSGVFLFWCCAVVWAEGCGRGPP